MDLNVGCTIKKLRLTKGVTQEELAEYIGVSFQAVSKWETGTTMPDIALLPKLAVFFGVRIDDLFSVNLDDELDRIDHMLAHEQLTDQNFTYAKRTLDAILRENENDVGALKRYVELYLKKNKRDSLLAGHMLERAMELAPLDTETYTLYRRVRGGDKNAVQSDNDWFIRVCEPYAKKYPQNYKLHEMLIEAMIEMRYYDKAESLIKLMQLDGDLVCMREIFLGDMVAAKGDIETAKRVWNNIPSNSHKGQYEAGERFNRINEYDKAIECYENSFRVASPPRDLSAVYSLAFLYTKLGRNAEAIEAWERIIDVLAIDHNITDSEIVDWARSEIKKLEKSQ